MSTASPARTESQDLIERIWTHHIEPALHEYITIPNVSEAYDADWRAHGHMQRAVDLVSRWCAARPIAGLALSVNDLPDRTPLIVIDIPAFNGGSDDDPVLLYGHLDKQPEMVGWRDGLGPWTPVVENGRLYGRGGGDDGYAAFASLAAIEVAQATGMAHNRCVVLIEASEESGSPDLPAHLVSLRGRIGTPSLVLCLDSGCLDYDRLWVTTSLRGLAACTVTVQILTEGVHSGEASSIVPSSFRIIRQLLDRLEDSATGDVLLPELHVEIPADRTAQAAATAAEFPEPISTHFPFVPGATPMVTDAAEQLIAHTWRPSLSVTGVAGIPDVAIAGNVLRPYTSLHLSFRLPPTCDSGTAMRAISSALTAASPYGARVTVTDLTDGPGWNAPPFAPWLDQALEDASNEYFGRPSRAFGEGGTIPFMGMLGKMFPEAQFVITGVLGPGSNAHGPNEFLDLAAARKVTGCLARILASHAGR
ncbi:MAG: peptidase family protein [Ilumatobacteraceae bacterium]|nr:peptidase family protein [Ilumatobacteraceae bacterium]